MKVLITGADGLLGQDIARAMASSADVLSLGRKSMDVTNVEKVFQIISGFRPHLVVHCAAYTDIAGCEEDVTRAFHVNAMGAQNVALACLEQKAAMAYISCVTIFDGASSHPYWEYDYPNPGSIYGKSKLAGERAVTQHLNHFFIIRTGWLFGKGRTNFVSTVLSQAAGGRDIKAASDHFGTPTYTADLAASIKELVKSPFYGIYHMTNAGECSWHQFAQEILEASGYEGVAVTPVSMADLPGGANRSLYAVLNNSIHQLRGFSPIRHYKDAMTSYLKDAGVLAADLK